MNVIMIIILIVLDVSFICVSILYGMENINRMKRLERECEMRKREIVFLAKNISRESGIDIKDRNDEDIIRIVDAVCSEK